MKGVAGGRGSVSTIATSIALALLFGALKSIPTQANGSGSALDTAYVSDLGGPPGEWLIASDGEAVVTPFEFYRDKLRFKAEINGRVCFMTLDNGSLWDEILFFGSPKVDSL